MTKITFVAPTSSETFTIVGKREIKAGYLTVAGRSFYEDGNSDVPTVAEHQSYRISSAKLKQGQTSAPGHLTESELIGLMEKHGIGTDASIATHINNIIVRNYVTLGSGRTLIPTPLGVVLVHGNNKRR